MKNFKKQLKYSLLMALVLICMSCMPALAGELSDDNSLASLGITNGEVSPEFEYSTVEYEVTVPAGTTKLELDPQTSNANAQIVDISDTTLVNGAVDVSIVVRSESGIDAEYVLHVKAAAGEAGGEAQGQTEAGQQPPQTEQKVTEPPTEAPQTETPNVQASLAESEANSLRLQLDDLKDKNSMTLKVIYGLIALAVILLFIIINLILKNRDLKDDLRDAENELDYQTNEFARKEKSMSTDNYYAPTQGKSGDPYQEAPDTARHQEEVEETFRQTPPSNAPKDQGGRKGRKASKKEEKAAAKSRKRAPKAEPEREDARAPREMPQEDYGNYGDYGQEPPAKAEDQDVDVNMVDL